MYKTNYAYCERNVISLVKVPTLYFRPDVMYGVKVECPPCSVCESDICMAKEAHS